MTQPKKTYGGEELAEYIPPTLFPRIGAFRDLDDQRQYVYDEMVRMARDKTLCLTDMLAQPSRIRNLCGRIIKGLRIDPEAMREARGEPLPPDVLGMMIKISAIDYGSGRPNIKFKHGCVRDPRKAQTLRNETSISQDGKTWSARLIPMVDEWWDYGAPDAEMDLDAAWICLSQYGENCRRATMKNKHKYWMYREVDSDGKPMIRHKPEPVENEPEQQERQPRRVRA